ncbi:MAG TPA: PHP domain-containing protein [Phycisphaerales bacterium]|nr:PHP domain-containing protein [Phycisphaerales bacterium]
MPVTNSDIAAQLGQLAQLLRSQGANRFKVKAYRAAAEAIQNHPQRLSAVIAEGKPLPKIPGVGASIAAAINEIVESGGLTSVKTLAGKLPPGTAEIAHTAGLSIREAKQLATTLGVTTATQLRERLESEDIPSTLGRRLVYKARQGLHNAKRLLWSDANELAAHYQTALEAVKGIDRIETAGSLRRGKETVGTIRLVIRTTAPGAARSLRALLRRHEGIESLHNDSAVRTTCKLAAGPLLVVRTASAVDFGAALVEETGSLAHLQSVQALAAPGRQSARNPAATEKAWYAARGLPLIPPELREGRGEVEAALAGQLPVLVELGDIRGDLHAHTTSSDGANTIEEMAAAAQARGYEYLAITDHSKSLKITDGLDEKRLRRQMASIDRLNAKLPTSATFRVLKGSEVDILEDGALDFDDSLLRELDIVIASIHSRFALEKADQTRRLLRAIENPYVTCIGHLTGRKLLKRPGYELDVERVLKAVKRNRKLLEINASPDRLDVDDDLARRARELGIPLLVNTDAHSIRELDFMPFGIRQARRGWQSRDTVVNTRRLPELLRVLAATRRKG